MLEYALFYILSTFVASVSQVLLKLSTKDHYDNIMQEYLNRKVIIAYIMFFGASLITLYAYKGVPVSLGPVLESSGYIFVTILGYLFLQERITRQKLFGIMLVCVGILIFYI